MFGCRPANAGRQPFGRPLGEAPCTPPSHGASPVDRPALCTFPLIPPKAGSTVPNLTKQGDHYMDEAMKQDVRESSEARATFYRFLASVYFTELTVEQIETLAAQEFPQDDSEIAQGYATIKEYLRHRDAGTRQELAVDYAHTFLSAGMYDTVMAPPYESVFTSEQHLLMQEARDGAVAFYRAEGIDLPTDNTTPEDHVSFEMQFMARLIDRAVEAIDEGDDAEFARLVGVQDRFLAEHLENWIPAFTQAIDEHARTDFYRGVASLTRGFLALDREVVDDLAAYVSEQA